VAKIGHAPFVDTEQPCGNHSGEVVYESLYLVGELLAERGDWRFDGIAGHADESALISPTTVIGRLPSGTRARRALFSQPLAKFGGSNFPIRSPRPLAKFGERPRR